jgi:hypothetical protein
MSPLRSSRARKRLVALACSIGLAAFGTATTTTTASAATPAQSTWATQMQFTDPNGQPWSTAAFAALKSDGMNTVEVNLAWNSLEPSRDSFDFSILDTELAHAAAAGIKLVPIFWQSVWGGNPASWITSHEVTNTGAQGSSPAWWDLTGQQDYFHYVTTTVAHIKDQAAYGGSILDYGSLDAQWHDPAGYGGYAPADIAEFHRWLPDEYGTLAKFNAKFDTTYTSWDDVPSAQPGDVVFPAFQEFRVWSVQDTYGRLTAAVRKVSAGPLFYYYGGHLGNARDYANLPDIFFRLARTYHVTIIEDAADSTGLSLLFGSLAHSYGVPLMQEWTARASGLQAEAGQWLVHYGFGMPNAAGEDFFIHDGTDKDKIGYPIYTRWLPYLKNLKGSYANQPVALYVSFASAHGDPNAIDDSAVENEIAADWSDAQTGFTVVTDEEVSHHIVDLSKFKAVLPMNGTDAYLQQYAAHGGHLLTSADELGKYAQPYADLTASHLIETVPTVAANRKSAAILIAEVNQFYDYSGSVTVRTSGLDLKAGPYHLVDKSSGKVLPQKAVSGGICAPLQLASADMAEWDVVAGAVPTGTPVPSSCPDTGSGATTVSATAGGQSNGLMTLLVGASNQGADGNLRSVTVGGEPAVATWTAAESNAGCGCSNAYLQLDPGSQVARSAHVSVTVNYWAAPGQGFQVQYDGAGGPYENGPTVTSPGTNQWVTATVQLSDAAFNELQNESADLRLQASDSTQPLTIHSISISTAG